MAYIDELRQRYPKLAGMSDEQVATDYARRMGVDLPTAVGDLEIPQNAPGFKSSLKSALGSSIEGIGDIAADIAPETLGNNRMQRFGQNVQFANPNSVHGFSDFAESPWQGTKEIVGSALGYMAPQIIGGVAGKGLQVLGRGAAAARGAQAARGAAALELPVGAAEGALTTGADAAAMRAADAARLAPAGPGVLGSTADVVGRGLQNPWIGGVASTFPAEYQGIGDTQDETGYHNLLAKAGGALAASAIEQMGGPQRLLFRGTPTGRLANGLPRTHLDEFRTGVATENGVSILRSRPFATGLGVIGRSALEEGGEEMLQNPIEQLAGGQNPLASKQLGETAFGMFSGAIGGGMLGGGSGVHRGMQEAGAVQFATGVMNNPAATPQEIYAAMDIYNQAGVSDEVFLQQHMAVRTRADMAAAKPVNILEPQKLLAPPPVADRMGGPGGFTFGPTAAPGAAPVPGAPPTAPAGLPPPGQPVVPPVTPPATAPIVPPVAPVTAPPVVPPVAPPVVTEPPEDKQPFATMYTGLGGSYSVKVNPALVAAKTADDALLVVRTKLEDTKTSAKMQHVLEEMHKKLDNGRSYQEHLEAFNIEQKNLEAAKAKGAGNGTGESVLPGVHAPVKEGAGDQKVTNEGVFGPGTGLKNVSQHVQTGEKSVAPSKETVPVPTDDELREAGHTDSEISGYKTRPDYHRFKQVNEGYKYIGGEFRKVTQADVDAYRTHAASDDIKRAEGKKALDAAFAKEETPNVSHILGSDWYSNSDGDYKRAAYNALERKYAFARNQLASVERVLARTGKAKPAEKKTEKPAAPAAFVPSHKWQVVHPDAVLPPGLEISMNQATGVNKARLSPGTLEFQASVAAAYDARQKADTEKAEQAEKAEQTAPAAPRDIHGIIDLFKAEDPVLGSIFERALAKGTGNADANVEIAKDLAEEGQTDITPQRVGQILQQAEAKFRAYVRHYNITRQELDAGTPTATNSMADLSEVTPEVVAEEERFANAPDEPALSSDDVKQTVDQGSEIKAKEKAAESSSVTGGKTAAEVIDFDAAGEDGNTGMREGVESGINELKYTQVSDEVQDAAADALASGDRTGQAIAVWDAHADMAGGKKSWEALGKTPRGKQTQAGWLEFYSTLKDLTDRVRDVVASRQFRGITSKPYFAGTGQRIDVSKLELIDPFEHPALVRAFMTRVEMGQGSMLADRYEGTYLADESDGFRAGGQVQMNADLTYSIIFDRDTILGDTDSRVDRLVHHEIEHVIDDVANRAGKPLYSNQAEFGRRSVAAREIFDRMPRSAQLRWLFKYPFTQAGMSDASFFREFYAQLMSAYYVPEFNNALKQHAPAAFALAEKYEKNSTHQTSTRRLAVSAAARPNQQRSDAGLQQPAPSRSDTAEDPDESYEAIKEKGGMWHPDSVNQLAGALGGVPYDAADHGVVRTPEQQALFDANVARLSPVRAWAEKAIRNWLNKYAGTDADPLKDVRIPMMGQDVRWENITDKALGSRPAADYGKGGSQSAIPGLNKLKAEGKVSGDEPIYNVGSVRFPRQYGHEGHDVGLSVQALQSYLSHVGDYLREFVPADKLQQYDLVRAVRETAAQDIKQAKKMETARASGAGTTLHKQYPDGMKWVEVGKGADRDVNDAALKNEGDTMGHCVGGYCEQVHAGESKIYSLRDAKGNPHVTIEVYPSEVTDVIEKSPHLVTFTLNGKPGAEVAEQADGTWALYTDELGNWGTYYSSKAAAMKAVGTSSINQIKGKQNRAPNAEYLPYVQDFVKSGEWGEVRDLQNTGLKYLGPESFHVRERKNKPGYFNKEEIGKMYPGAMPGSSVYFGQDDRAPGGGAYASHQPDTAFPDSDTQWDVIDNQTRQPVPGRGPYSTLRRASRAAEKLNLEYGAHRYHHRRAEKPADSYESRQPTTPYPKELKGTPNIHVQYVKDTVEHWAKLGLEKVVFLSDLTGIAEKLGLKSARPFADLNNQKAATRTRLENNVDRIMDDAASVTDRVAMDKFLNESTREGKWGFMPDWRTDAKLDQDFVNRFNLLSDKAQATVKAVFRYGDTTHQMIQDLVNREIEAEFAEKLRRSPQKAALIALEKEKRLKSKAARVPKVPGPYAPLKRFGEFVAWGKSQQYRDAEAANDNATINKLQDDEDHYIVEFFDGIAEAKARSREMAREYDYTDASVRQKIYHDIQEVPWGTIAKVRGAANEVAGEEKVKTALNSLLSDIYLTMLVETSARKAELRRKKTPGESKNMMRAFASQGRATSHFIAALQHNGEIEQHLRDMRHEAGDAFSPQGVRNDRTRVLNEIHARYAQGIDYRPTPFVDKAKRITSIWMLITSPGYLFQNSLQPFMLTLPMLSARFQPAPAAAAMWKAYKDIAPYIKNFNDTLHIDRLPVSPEERALLTKLLENGKLDLTISQDLGRWIDNDKTWTRNKFGQVWQKVQALPQKVEMINRVVSALAAHRLGGNYAYVNKLLDDTHGNYAPSNLPRFMTSSGAAKLIFQFRTYQLIQISLLGRLMHDAFKESNPTEKAVARRALLWLAAHHMVLAGTLGLPAVNLVGMVLTALGGDDDEPKDLERLLRSWIDDKTTSDLLLHGLPTAVGLDLTNKIGMGNAFSILPFTDLNKLDRDTLAKAALSAGGPFFGGWLPSMVDGMGYLAAGDHYKGLETLMPRGVRDAARAYRFASEGITNRAGRVAMTPEELNTWDIMMQAVGLPTQTITDRTRRQGDILEMETYYKDRAAELRHDYVRAYRAGNAEAMKEARDAWTAMQGGMSRNHFKVTPVSSLLQAPRAQAKLEKSNVGGVEVKKGSVGYARQLELQ